MTKIFSFLRVLGLGLLVVSASPVVSSAHAYSSSSGGTILNPNTCHIQLKSANGTVIELRYGAVAARSIYDGDTYFMDGIGIYASGPELQPSAKVRFVLISHNRNNPQSSQDVRTVDASYDYSAYGFEAAAHFALKTWSEYGGHQVIELAMVSDGNWLRDPISGNSNFQIDLSFYKDSCANPY